MLNKLITSKTRRKLLTLFLTNPGSRFYIRDISRRTGEQVNAVRKELNGLLSIGMLKKEEAANIHYYCANKDSLIFNEMKSIIQKTDPVLNLISRALQETKKEFNKNLTSVVLFGSVARNEIRKDSDVDLLIICKKLPDDWRKRDKTAIGLEKTGFDFGMAVHIELITEKEFKFSISNGAPLLFEVFSDHKIIYDTGFFRKQINLFGENIAKWNARKTGKYTWEVPELAVKI